MHALGSILDANIREPVDEATDADHLLRTATTWLLARYRLSLPSFGPDCLQPRDSYRGSRNGKEEIASLGDERICEHVSTHSAVNA
jgi:hypothetical protein